MGIRLHVSVGYGLNIRGMDKSFIEDFENLDDEDVFFNFHKEALDFIEQHGDFFEKILVKDYIKTTKMTPAFYEMMTYDPEFGYNDRLLLYPMTFKEEWSRYNDALDVFLFETQRDDAGIGEFKNDWLIKTGDLYPFRGLMRANSDKPLGIEFYGETDYISKNNWQDAIPKSPIHLWFLIKHLRLVPEDNVTETFLSLRPTIYRYWG